MAIGFRARTVPSANSNAAAKAKSTPEAVAAFQREIRAQAQLDHPNLVSAVDVFVEAGYLFLVMELVRGGDCFGYVRGAAAKDAPTLAAPPGSMRPSEMAAAACRAITSHEDPPTLVASTHRGRDAVESVST